MQYSSRKIEGMHKTWGCSKSYCGEWEKEVKVKVKVKVKVVYCLHPWFMLNILHITFLGQWALDTFFYKLLWCKHQDYLQDYFTVEKGIMI